MPAPGTPALPQVSEDVWVARVNVVNAYRKEVRALLAEGPEPAAMWGCAVLCAGRLPGPCAPTPIPSCPHRSGCMSLGCGSGWAGTATGAGTPTSCELGGLQAGGQ